MSSDTLFAELLDSLPFELMALAGTDLLRLKELLAKEDTRKSFALLLRFERAVAQEQEPTGDTSTSASVASTHSEVFTRTQLDPWTVDASPVERRVADYAEAYESAVQEAMIALLTSIGDECDLTCHDTHVSGVRGMLKPDAVFTLKASKFYTITARAVALLADFRARRALPHAGVFSFAPDEAGQVIDKLRRWRQAGGEGTLFGLLSNGFHYQLFHLAAVTERIGATAVCTLHDVGPLKAVLKMAAAAISDRFSFVSKLTEVAQYAHMSVRSLLGAGAHCRAWEFGDDNHRSVAVVVAETAEACKHLLHSYGVFEELAAIRAPGGLLYSPQFKCVVGEKAIVVFAEVGERWTTEMFASAQLTRQDVADIVDQIAHFHKHGYIHCDVALRNFVRFEDENGVHHSVLIDAGAAVKKGGKWCGGTVNNAAIGWLEDNLEKVDARRFADVAVPSEADELWSFVFAAMDLCFPKLTDHDKLIAFRRRQVCFPAVAAIGTLVNALDYAGVACAVADLLCLADDGMPLSPSRGSPEHLRTGTPAPLATSSHSFEAPAKPCAVSASPYKSRLRKKTPWPRV
jgi:hypothetical protein